MSLTLGHNTPGWAEARRLTNRSPARSQTRRVPQAPSRTSLRSMRYWRRGGSTPACRRRVSSTSSEPCPGTDRVRGEQGRQAEKQADHEPEVGIQNKVLVRRQAHKGEWYREEK